MNTEGVEEKCLWQNKIADPTKITKLKFIYIYLHLCASRVHICSIFKDDINYKDQGYNECFPYGNTSREKLHFVFVSYFMSNKDSIMPISTRITL